eukprot:gene11589-4832_t
MSQRKYETKKNVVEFWEKWENEQEEKRQQKLYLYSKKVQKEIDEIMKNHFKFVKIQKINILDPRNEDKHNGYHATIKIHDFNLYIKHEIERIHRKGTLRYFYQQVSMSLDDELAMDLLRCRENMLIFGSSEFSCNMNKLNELLGFKFDDKDLLIWLNEISRVLVGFPENAHFFEELVK